jgi:cytochrome c peroxidase
VLAGTARFSEQEAKGLELYRGKGKCANCHVLDAGPKGEPLLFTDFTYDNLGVPRNPDNPFYSQDATFNPEGKDWVDVGLGATLAKDPLYAALAEANMGKVKVPTLRNVDMRPSPGFVKAFMHNGYFKSLKSVVHFYNTRDTKPRCNDQMTRDADAMRIDCWPAPEVEANLNKDEMGDLKLTDAEEDAIVAFMKSLTDGFQPDAKP